MCIGGKYGKPRMHINKKTGRTGTVCLKSRVAKALQNAAAAKIQPGVFIQEYLMAKTGPRAWDKS